MNLEHKMGPRDNLFDLFLELQARIEELEDRYLGYKYNIQELETNIRELQSQIQAVDDRIDILRGENDV